MKKGKNTLEFCQVVMKLKRRSNFRFEACTTIRRRYKVKSRLAV